LVEDEEAFDEEPQRPLEDWADAQYGLFTLDQALVSGMNRTTVYRRAGLGRYVREHPRVFAFAGLPESWQRLVLSARLAAGQEAVASHRSAARLWGLIDASEDIVEITVPCNQRPRLSGVTVHRSADLQAEHTTVRRRIPVTNPLRTMVDLASVLKPDAVEDALDAGLAYPSLFSVRAVEAMRSRLAQHGRARTGVLRQVLRERALGDAVSDSKLEGRMAELLRRAGLPAAVFHYAICTPAGVFLAEVDFAYPDIKLAIEVDGFGVHGTPRAMAKDFVRQNGLVPYGWRVLRFTWRQVTRQPEMVAAAIRVALVSLVAA
jgi:very-short-patch-repair endonuclease